MEYEIDFLFSSFNEKWKMENGYSIFHFSFLIENENNGMYPDLLYLVVSLLLYVELGLYILF